MAMTLRGRPASAVLTAILLAAIAVPALAQTPSLGEIARQEQERRKGLKKPTKVLTNEDLKNGGSPPEKTKPQAQPTRAEAPKPSAETKKSAEADEIKSEAAWRARITTARDELRRNQVFAEALQSRINALTADFSARDNPIERAQIADDRQKALADLERVKADVEKSQKQIADIEEEARKAGVPPGWLR